MTVPYTFATATGNVPLAELDANFASVANNVSSANTALTAGTVTTNAQPNITSVGTLTSLSVTGNVVANLFVGTISGSISNAVYANTAGFATTAGTANSATVATTATTANSAAVATTAGTVTTAAQPNITSVGTLTSLSVAGNVTANLFVGNIAGSIANAAYATTAGFATTAGTANSATTANTATSSTTAGTVTTAAQPNITSVGTLTSLSVSGNITAGNVIATNLSGPIVLAYNTTNQNLSTGATVLKYSTAVVNTSNYYNPTTGIFTPLVPGYYQVNLTMAPGLISGSPEAIFQLGLYKNGTIIAISPTCTVTSTTPILSNNSVSAIVSLNGTTDYLGVAYQSTIVSGTWRTTVNGVTNYFQACWIRGI
jgi:hypothetical protein